jgi:hypothetical protein
MWPGDASMPANSRRLTAGLAMAALLAATASARADELEYEVKAEFVERFTHFIDWPPNAFGNLDAPFTLCILGESPIAPYLEKLARERRIKERRVEVRHVKPTQDLGMCHLLLFAASERPRLRQTLQRIAGRPVLTVGDAEGFAREGVLINMFINEEGRVHFEICSNELKRSGLRISAQLLRLARVVSEGGQ